MAPPTAAISLSLFKNWAQVSLTMHYPNNTKRCLRNKVIQPDICETFDGPGPQTHQRSAIQHLWRTDAWLTTNLADSRLNRSKKSCGDYRVGCRQVILILAQNIFPRGGSKNKLHPASRDFPRVFLLARILAASTFNSRQNSGVSSTSLPELSPSIKSVSSLLSASLA